MTKLLLLTGQFYIQEAKFIIHGNFWGGKSIQSG